MAKLQFVIGYLLFAALVLRIDASWKGLEKEGKNVFQILKDFLPIARGYIPQWKQIGELYNKRKERPDLYGGGEKSDLPKTRTVVIKLRDDDDD